MKKILIFILVVVGLLLPGTATAYQVPAEHKNSAMVEIDLYALAKEHVGESWADYIINDIRYKHHARNIKKFDEEMAYQATLPRLTKNNLVVQNQ